MPITIKYIKAMLLIKATLLISAFSCNKNGSKPCTMVTPFSFNVTSEFFPQRETYNIGDTIFLHSSFPKSLLNQISNQQVDYGNSLGISGNLAIGLLDSNSRTILYALPKFKVINISGTTSPIPNATEGGLNIFYKEDSIYNFKLGIICLNKGVYRIGLTDLSSQGISGKDCTNAGFNMTVTNANKNLNLFQNAIGYYPDALAIKTIYCFRVN